MENEIISFNDFNNAQVAALPAHLKQFIVSQHYERYTSIDHAVWRYVMRQNYSYLKDVAYYPYIPGLKAAGLTIDRIPDLQEMNGALGKIGWGAVTVDGFIPPAAFMEFQAYRVLVIAADIRTLAHIEYTPAPDIIHESAGHAPIIADKDYHEYLSYFGSIGTKAMFSAQDFELYEAIRALSILKEQPNTDPTEIKKAEELVLHRQENIGEPSEMALLSRLHWWTVEYGLIGTLDNPKIYGAGLLSSIGESFSCLQPDVAKLHYAIDAVDYPYDITKPQPQLFVTPDFQSLTAVLEAFADTMSFRVGGIFGLKKAIDCRNICTVVFSSGLQVTGTFSEYKENGNQLSFIKTAGPTALSYADKQLNGHGKDVHCNGFSSPVGKLLGESIPLEYKLIEAGKFLVLHFESGILVLGQVVRLLRKNDKNVLISFEECTVMDRMGKVLFEPSWGRYDLAVGEKIVSVYCGAADKAAFEESVYISNKRTFRANDDPDFSKLYESYGRVSAYRQKPGDTDQLIALWHNLSTQFPDDWLCALEILEILTDCGCDEETTHAIITFLKNKAIEKPEIKTLITNGLTLVGGIYQKMH